MKKHHALVKKSKSFDDVYWKFLQIAELLSSLQTAQLSIVVVALTRNMRTHTLRIAYMYITTYCTYTCRPRQNNIYGLYLIAHEDNGKVGQNTRHTWYATQRFRPSVAGANEQFDPRCRQQTYHRPITSLVANTKCSE